MAGYPLGYLERIAALRKRRADRDEADDVLEIAMAKERHTYASVITVDASGDLVFDTEQDVIVDPGEEVEVRLRDDPAALHRPTWRSFAVRIQTTPPSRKRAKNRPPRQAAPTSRSEAKKRSMHRVRSGHAVVVASYPFSTNWVDSDRFRRSAYKHEDAAWIESEKRKALAACEGVEGYLRGLRCDLFETRTNYLVARLDHPSRIDERAAEVSRQAGTRSTSITDGRPWHRRLLRLPRGGYRDVEESWVFGICRDVEKCLRVLRRSKTAERLVAQTQDGTLLEEYFTGFRPEHLADLCTEAKEMAREVLEASAFFAIAGPNEGCGAEPAGDPDWIRRPVTKLLERIYPRLMLNLNKRLSPREPAARGTPDVGDPSSAGRLESFHDLVDRLGVMLCDDPTRRDGELLDMGFVKIGSGDPNERILGWALIVCSRTFDGLPSSSILRKLDELRADESDQKVRKSADIAMALVRQFIAD